MARSAFGRILVIGLALLSTVTSFIDRFFNFALTAVAGLLPRVGLGFAANTGRDLSVTGASPALFQSLRHESRIPRRSAARGC